ncbi:hypothetical protein GCM10009784_03640 [Arthrobacter parietis]|uniref:Fibronectin type-III domain-containing protein n=1 Tax=Arthrobacter parietis TaxID=271434 RepID=A0ABN3AN26_9MICC
MNSRSPVTSVPSAKAPRSRKRALPALLAGSTTVVLVAAGASVVMAANPPVGPGNVEIFTKRDMVAIEGYTAQAGQDATIKVTRDGNLIGIAHGVVDATGFLEVNHPGGVCWDVVTPNITGKDVVSVEFADGSGDGANAGTAVITSVTREDLPATDIAGDVEGRVVVKGTYGTDVDTARMGVEIVNPDMRDMGIGERAIGWPDDEVPAGYTVDGTAANGAFTVTYGFFSKAEQDAAFAGDPSVASWQAEPATVEAQLGLTISEFKEIDGPGFGGCPAGPAGQAPNQPTEVFAKASGNGTLTATWAPATVPADAPAITGYQVIAADTVLGQEVSIKVGSTATTATIQGLVGGQVYPVSVVALNGQASMPASGGNVTVSATAVSEATAPTAPGSVAVKDGTLAGSADVTWTAATANGAAVTGYRVDATTSAGVAKTVTAASGATSARLEGLTPGTAYGIVVTALSAAGDTSATPTAFTPVQVTLQAPAAPKVVRTTVGNGTATVEWQAAVAANTPITGYILTATPATGTPVTVTTDAAARTAVLNGLTNGTAYSLKLVATSAAGNSAPATFGAGASATVTPADQLTASAQFRSDRREWRITGTATITAGNTITARSTNLARSVIGTATVAADGSWTIRTRNSTAPATATITISSSAGGSITIPVSTR